MKVIFIINPKLQCCFLVFKERIICNNGRETDVSILCFSDLGSVPWGMREAVGIFKEQSSDCPCSNSSSQLYDDNSYKWFYSQVGLVCFLFKTLSPNEFETRSETQSMRSSVLFTIKGEITHLGQWLFSHIQCNPLQTSHYISQRTCKDFFCIAARCLVFVLS